jgi:O-antigen/teichoic acid export membrane protein
VILKYLADPDFQHAQVIGGSLILRALGALCGFFVVASFATIYFDPKDALLKTMLLFAASGYFIAIPAVYEAALRNRLQAKQIALNKTSGILASGAIKLGLIALGLPFSYFVIPVMVEVFVVSVLFWRSFRMSEPGLRLDGESRTVGRRILGEAWPLALSGLAGTLYFHADKLFIFDLLTSADLGRYALLTQIVAVLNFVTVAINMSFAPMLNRRFFENLDRFWPVYQRMTAAKLAASLLIALTFGLLAPWVLPILFGDEFYFPWDLVAIFSVYIALVGLCSFSADYMLLQKRSRQILYFRLVALAINLILNALFIPQWGLQAAAASSVFCYLLTSLLLPLFLPEMRFFWRQTVSSTTLILMPAFYRQIFSLSRAERGESDGDSKAR